VPSCRSRSFSELARKKCLRKTNGRRVRAARKKVGENYLTNSIVSKRTLEFNNINIFETARQIPLIEVVQKYSNNKLTHKGGRWSGLCPIHTDRSPSFIIYPDGRFKCFGCGASGSGIDFVSQLLNISPLEAAKQICHDFGLQVEPLSDEIWKRQKKRKLEHKLNEVFEQLVKKSYQQLTLLIRSVERIHPELWEDEGLVNMIHALPQIEFYAEVLRCGTDREKFDLIMSGRLRAIMLYHLDIYQCLLCGL